MWHSIISIISVYQYHVFVFKGLESVAGCTCRSQCSRKLKVSVNGKVSGCPCKGMGYCAVIIVLAAQETNLARIRYAFDRLFDFIDTSCVTQHNY